MNQGKIEQIGTPEDVYHYPTTRFVADFIGRANFLPVNVEAVQSNLARVSVLGRTLEVPARFNLSPGDTIIAMLRPEAFSLRQDETLPQAGIEQAMYLGTEIEYVVTLNGQRLTIVDNDPRRQHMFAEGQSIGVDFIPEAVHLLPE
jgi:iron(III) transport system ATP-binding protein